MNITMQTADKTTPGEIFLKNKEPGAQTSGSTWMLLDKVSISQARVTIKSMLNMNTFAG